MRGVFDLLAQKPLMIFEFLWWEGNNAKNNKAVAFN